MKPKLPLDENVVQPALVKVQLARKELSFLFASEVPTGSFFLMGGNLTYVHVRTVMKWLSNTM